jgi:hypothetical protein
VAFLFWVEKIEMKPAEFIAEHKRLIQVLTKGTKKERVKEAAGQTKELMKMLMRINKGKN